MASPLHTDSQPSSQRAAQALRHLKGDTALQFMAELHQSTREGEFPWWTADILLQVWSVEQRMADLKGRPDLRLGIVRKLTGMPEKAALQKTPQVQAERILEVLESGDTTATDVELAFDPKDAVTYGPTDEFYRQFLARMPWEEDVAAHQELVSLLIEALMRPRLGPDNNELPPILSAWDVVDAIPDVRWHTDVPLELRCKVHQAWLAQQKSDTPTPYTAAEAIRIVTPEVIARSIKLNHLKGIFDLACERMGFIKLEPVPEQEAEAANVEAPPPQEAANDKPKLDDEDLFAHLPGPKKPSDEINFHLEKLGDSEPPAKAIASPK